MAVMGIITPVLQKAELRQNLVLVKPISFKRICVCFGTFFMRGRKKQVFTVTFRFEYNTFYILYCLIRLKSYYQVIEIL